MSLDNYLTGKKENEQKGCTYIHGDVGDLEFWGRRLEKDDMIPDVIFHLAALARIQPSIKNPTKTLKNNIISTMNVLEYARKNDIQVVYAGSSSFHYSLYGSAYAWSKYGGEELCRLYSGCYDLNTTICRFYNVYGLHQILDGAYAAVVGIFQDQYLNNKPLTITGDGEQRRDFTHVSDIVDGLVRCVGKDYRAEEFELGSGTNYSINELADMFDTEKTYIPPRPGEYPATLCDYSKAKTQLGYRPKDNLKQYINQWLEENK